MKALALTCAMIALAAAPARGEDVLGWDHEGYGSLHDAAREAKGRGARILLGLSGSRH